MSDTKKLHFDATEVNTTSRNNYLSVEIETPYLEEVLSNFTTDDIMENYGDDLLELYEKLKVFYGDE